MLKKFYKMQGIGNDYIYFDCMKENLKDADKLSIRLSDRHFGIGGDGIILLLPSDKADIKMAMYNADGSEGKMCGNGIRCLSKLAYILGYVKREGCTVETLSGIKTVRFDFDGDELTDITVDMGAPILEGAKIPSVFSGATVVNQPLTVNGSTHFITLVSMGNPHCVVFENPDELADIKKTGSAFENHSAFPDRINTEFVKVISPTHLKMRVWERGSGETFACGTGACASAVAAILNGYCKRGEDITLSLLGGKLKIKWTDSVYMTGPAELVFTGEIEI